MKFRIMMVCGLGLGLLLASTSSGVMAQSGAGGADEPYAGEAVCLPGVYLQAPDGCLALGPSETLTEMSKAGFSYPERALPASKPDPALSQVSANYARIPQEQSEPAPIYATLEDAEEGQNPVGYLSAGKIRYISFINQQDIDGKHYLQLADGRWMLASPAAYSHYQGLVFHANPQNGFGWVLTSTFVRTLPGFANPETEQQLIREDLVQVYATQDVDNVTWLEIGQDEWVEDRVVGRVTLNTTPPTGITGTRWIEVNLAEQTLAVYDNSQLVFATLVSTGLEPFYTKPGVFQIKEKKEMETMLGSFEADRSDYYYLENVPWTMYYDGIRALHGAYWHNAFGYPTSHGCINLSPGDSHWLFNWANEGDWVYVWDPSGLTPTDPEYYKEDAAF